MTGSKWVRRIEDFFLLPASPRPLAYLRIGLALVLLAQAWMLRHSTLDFFSAGGIVQAELANSLNEPGAPRISLALGLLSPFHLSEASGIGFVCCLYAASLVLLALGLFTRFAALASWFLHWTLMNTSDTTTYGVDIYAHVFLFYLIWIPCGAVLSLDALRREARRKAPVLASSGARLALRVLQLQLCITYLCSAVEKASGEQWWNGEVLWRAFSLPVYRQFDMSWLAYWPHLSQLAGISALTLEAGYVIFIWPRLTRRLWIFAIVSMHLSIALMMGLHLFGIIMALFTLCVFGASSEPLGEPAGEPVPEPARLSAEPVRVN